MKLKYAAALVCAVSTPVYAATFTADVWADNWFELRINGNLVAQDSVPITTERSFNAESFSFEAKRPFVIGLVAMDFKENDSGLEYIGTRRQQMGDGGVIAQIIDNQKRTVVSTNANWRCLVVHTAPLDKQCEKAKNPIAGEGVCQFREIDPPERWDSLDFDDSDWKSASAYSEADVRPKGGYDQIRWDDAAQLIWGPDLETDNTVLCRMTVK